MTKKPIRVLIVDDSVFMRSMLKSALSSCDHFEIIGTAQNGEEGIRKIVKLKPDVVTLDVEMPGLDGIGALERIMKEFPLPVVMISTKTQKGAQVTLEALQKGAVDYVAKPLGDKSSSLQSFREAVTQAVEAAAASNRNVLGTPRAPFKSTKTVDVSDADVIVAIGISAGGPATLHEMLPAMPGNFPPIVITQHMPADFTKPFASRLDAVSQVTVRHAETNLPLVPGEAIIASGAAHLKIIRRLSKLVATLDDGPKVSGFRPSVDVMFDSVAKVVGPRAVGVIMTGMGCDGSVGIRTFRENGAATIAQDQKTSIVYGMPKAAADTGCIDRVVPLSDIPRAISEALSELAACQR